MVTRDRPLTPQIGDKGQAPDTSESIQLANERVRRFYLHNVVAGPM